MYMHIVYYAYTKINKVCIFYMHIAYHSECICILYVYAYTKFNKVCILHMHIAYKKVCIICKLCILYINIHTNRSVDIQSRIEIPESSECICRFKMKFYLLHLETTPTLFISNSAHP